MARAALPLLVRVTVCGPLVVPKVTEPKFRLVAERLTAGPLAVNFAVMISSAFTVSEHVYWVPEQAPEALPHPANVDWESGMAVSVTGVPAA